MDDAPQRFINKRARFRSIPNSRLNLLRQKARQKAQTSETRYIKSKAPGHKWVASAFQSSS